MIMLLRATSIGKLPAARGRRKSFVLICDIDKIYFRIKNSERLGRAIPLLASESIRRYPIRLAGSRTCDFRARVVVGAPARELGRPPKPQPCIALHRCKGSTGVRPVMLS